MADYTHLATRHPPHDSIGPPSPLTRKQPAHALGPPRSQSAHLLKQQLHGPVLVAPAKHHTRQKHLRVHDLTENILFQGQVKRRPQPRLSTLVLGSRLRQQRLAKKTCCTCLLLRVAELLTDGPGTLETGDRPVVLSMPGQAATEVRGVCHLL